MATIASLNVEIGANAGNALRVFDQVGAGLQELGRDASQSAAALGGSMAGAMDNAAAAAGRAAVNMERAGASFANTAKNYRAIGASITDVGESLTKYVTLPLVLLGGASLKAYGDLQALEKGFAAVYKGATPAGEELAKLSEVAKLPGLGLKEAIQGSIRLQAVGFSAEQSRKTLSAFGNAIATVGGGKAELDGVTLALTQIASKGKISAEEINQLAERVPQVRKAMQNVFGTADTEQLQKMGIGAEEFIYKLTQEMAKLPAVTGGMKNAFENMADAGFLALTKVGEALNNSFNVEGIFGRISDALVGAADAFGALNPVAQTTILLFAGVAAAAGPLLLIAGSLVTAWGTVGLSMAAITGPIGLAIIGIAAAAVLLIANWDKVTAYFQNSGLASTFSALGDSIAGAVDGIVGHLSNLVALATPIWNGFVELFSSNLTAGLTLTVNTLTTAFDIMGKGFAVFNDVFSGNWSNLWTSAGNLVSSIWNGIVNTIFTAASSIVRIGGGLAKAFGLDSIGDSFNSASASIAGVGKSLNSAYNEAAQVSSTLTPLADKTALFGRNIQEAFGGVPDYVFQAQHSIATTDAKLDEFVRKPHVKNVKVVIEKTPEVGALQSQIAAGLEKIKPPKLNNAGLTLEGLLGLDPDRFKLNPINMMPIDLAAMQATFDGAAGMTSAYITRFMEMKEQMGTALTDLAVNNLAGFAEALGATFAGNTGAMSAFLNTMLTSILDFAAQFGKALIAVGIGKLSLDSLFAAGPAGAAAAIAAGAGLLALVGAARAVLKKGPSYGGGGAGGGTPAATPYRSPSSTFAPSALGVGANTEVTFRVAGTDLIGVLRNQNYKDGR